MDFTVSYYDSTGNTPVNAMTEVGVYTVRFIGIVNYTGNNFDLAYTILNTPRGGGGGGSTAPDTEEPEDFANNSGVTDPNKTGVSNWLITSDHMYMSGYPGNLFGPDNSMTRAEAAQLFYNLLLDRDVCIAVSFKNVAADAWYAKAVNTLASLDIIKGVSPNDWFYESVVGAMPYGWIQRYPNEQHCSPCGSNRNCKPYVGSQCG